MSGRCLPRAPVASPALEFAQVTKSLAGTPVLTGLSFRCPPGTITALLGPNGAGKTTAVTLATGLRRPDSGVIRVGAERAGQVMARRQTSLVPQEIGFPEPITVAHCLRFVAAQRPWSPYAQPDADLCDILGLTPLLERRIGGLSGGQRRRLAIALGLLRAPRLLIMDEATTNLDEQARAATWQLVRGYAGRGGAALVTSHILADIDAHADRLVALAGGRTVLAGPIADVRARLGGSIVSVRLAPAERCSAWTAVARCADSDPLPQAANESDVVTWRTNAPLQVVRALADAVPDARELRVRPVPLEEILQALRAADPAPREPCAAP